MEKYQDAVISSEKISVKRKVDLIDQFKELMRTSSPQAVEAALAIIQKTEL